MGESPYLSQYRDRNFHCQLMARLKVDGLLAALIPKQCILCRQPSGAVNCCHDCREDLPWIHPACRRCGAPVSPELPGLTCAVCQLPLRTIERVSSALVYEYPVDSLITRAKFQARMDAARTLGELLAEYLLRQMAQGMLDPPDYILPVPLHRKRLARRGFNQALEIAGPVAERLGLSVRPGICHRTRHTLEQTTLAGGARLRNTRDAFRARGDLSGCHIAIIDDVVTTGSTVAAIAEALRAKRADRIQVWTTARAYRPSKKDLIQRKV
jgi:ComF family protein